MKTLMHAVKVSEVPAVEEFGAVNVVEIRRLAYQGALRPLVCVGEDGRLYYVKPRNCGGWPLSLEWICARLGRRLQLPIPNYRQVVIRQDLIAAWNTTGTKVFVEAGIGFGSQQVESADEANPELVARIDPALRGRILWFDWWVRNGDRRESNPNLLWSHGDNSCFLIDHEKAGDSANADEFWRSHLFRTQATDPPLALLEEMRAVLPALEQIKRELPQDWVEGTNGLDWFLQHLRDTLFSKTNGQWEPHEE